MDRMNDTAITSGLVREGAAMMRVPASGALRR
jgi:Holliday junction resolvase